MTVAPQLAIGQTSQNGDDCSFSVFQSTLNPNAGTLIAGNFFFGLQGYVAVRIPMGELLGLARGANIETALTQAIVTFTAAGSWTAGGAISCNVMVDDSPRGSSEDGLGEASPFDSRLAMKSPNGYGPAWRRDHWGQFDARFEDSGAGFIDLGPGNSGTFGILQVAGLRAELAQILTIPAGPDFVLRRAIMELRRFGNPIGSMEVAIQGSQSNGFGRIEPDGVDLGVSAAVLNSTVPLTPGSGPITYTFTPDVVLAPGTYWAVLRPSVPYTPDLTNFIVWMQQRLFFGAGGSHRTLAGAALGDRFNSGLYPGHIDVHWDTAAKQVGADIIWNPIARSAGQSVSTPDLSPLVSEVIKTSGHETASALIFTFRTVGETRTYRFAGNAHATYNPPGFACQFRRRNNRAEVI